MGPSSSTSSFVASSPPADPADVAALEPATTRSRRRDDIADRYKWNLTDIFATWEEWEAGYTRLEAGIDRYAALQGTLAEGPGRLLDAFRLSETLGQLAYRVWYFPSLRYDEDQRDNGINAKRQQVQILFARWKQAESWFNPELLKIPLATVRGWMDGSEPLRLYRFAIEDLYRQHEHVLDEGGERLMSLASRLASGPNDAYWALSTADAKFPTVRLSTGEDVTVSYGQYRAILATRREQADRAAAFRALHETYQNSLNTYTTIYNGVCQRDWFQARARGYASTLDGALHGDNIPTSVVENLIATTRAGVGPLQRYHQLRRRTLGVPSYHVYDYSIPLVAFDRKYRVRPRPRLDRRVGRAARTGVPGSPARRIRRRLDRRLRKRRQALRRLLRAGVRHAPIHAPQLHGHPRRHVHPGARDGALDAHHPVARGAAVRVSSYTIFVAEVPSTLSEALLLDYLLARSTDPTERVVLLQHAIDNIAGTFYTQVLFADYELRAHRLAERDQPITAEILTEIYRGLLVDYYGDSLDLNEQTGITWSRIPHFFNSPYYVYQYATCFASAARLAQQIMHGPEASRHDARDRFLTLLRSGGNDYPMEQLKKAGVDLSQPDTVLAIVNQLDDLVTRLEKELAALA